MEKVPRVLWWLLGGLVVLTAGVLVDVLPPSHGQKPVIPDRYEKGPKK